MKNKSKQVGKEQAVKRDSNTADDILINKISLPQATVVRKEVKDESASEQLETDQSEGTEILESDSADESSSDADITFGHPHPERGEDEPDNFFFDMGYVSMINATTIYFNCYVEKHTVDQAIRMLRDVNRHIATVEVEYPELKGQLKPKFVINSGGGSVVQGLRLFDRLKHNQYEVSTIVDGMAASMGIILAVAGVKKQSTPNSVLMIHQLSAGASGKYRELMDYAKYQAQLQTKLANILKNNTKAKPDDIDEFMKGETYIMAEDALKMGLIDEIVHL